jgi:hypothetical protein
MHLKGTRINSTCHLGLKSITGGLKSIQEQRRAAQQEKDTLQVKFEEHRVKIQKEKEKLLMKQIGIEEVVNRAFFSVTGLEHKAEDPIERQVMTLVEVIQQLQQRVIDLEL